MASQPDPTHATTVDEWWSKIDLRAPIDSDLVAGAHRELSIRHRDDVYRLSTQDIKTQTGYFTARLDDHIAELRERHCNRAVEYKGRFIADLQFYAGVDDQIERRGLVELRNKNGQNLVITGERIRPIASGAAPMKITFTGNNEAPELSFLLSPRGYASELNKIAQILKTPIGQELLEDLSALYCLMRERISARHGASCGWDVPLRSFTPHWAGEETSFTFRFEGGVAVSAHPDYVADICSLGIRTRVVP